MSVMASGAKTFGLPGSYFFGVAAIALLFISSPAGAGARTPASTTELLVATREARNAKDFDRAEQLAREGMARSQDSVWPLTLALILADKARSKEALAVLSAPWPGGLPRVERLLAEGYAHTRGGDVWSALTAYGEVLLVQPDNAEARDAVGHLMDRVRGSFGATTVAGANPGREADEAAALVRWGGSLEPYDPAERFVLTDKALARLDTLLTQANGAVPVDEGLVRRLRIDRMVALRDRFRMAEVVSEGAALAATGAPLPSYGTHALADALLYERRPEDALVAYDTVLKADPGNLQAQYGHVFALVESERLSQAVAAADAIAAGQAPFQAYAGGPVAHPNTEYAYAAMLAGQVRLWSNDIEGGYTQLGDLSAAAPAHPEIRRALVSAKQARGWPRAAETEASIAASLDPGSLPTQIMLAEAALSRNRLDVAKADADRLVALAPEDQHVRRFADEVAAERGWSLEAEFGPKWNDGGGANASGEEWASTIRIQTPRIEHQFGVFALFDANVAHPLEGRATRYRAGGGIAFHGIDVTSTVYATTNWGSLSRGGGGATIDWEANDHVSLGLSGEIFSSETPLRAQLQGITADSLSARASWRQDERTQVWANGGWLSYSDGNDRLSASLVGEHLLWARPHLDVTGRAGLWYAHNSQPGGPYFAPKNELSGSGGFTIRQIAWRRYEGVFSHALMVDFGFQNQSGFAADWIGSVRYEHRWRHDPWWELYYAVLADRRVYDGEPERGIGGVLGFRRRF